jgi:hypothetical protein
MRNFKVKIDTELSQILADAKAGGFNLLFKKRSKFGIIYSEFLRYIVFQCPPEIEIFETLIKNST